MINANSFLGFMKKNPFKTPRSYALAAFIGFFVFIGIAAWIFASL